MEFDLIILGAGSGGYEAGLFAFRRGLSIAFVELSPESVGGNCLNKGCIPSKYMRHGAYIIEKISKAKNYGIKVKCGYEIDFKEAVRGRNKVIVTIRENFKKFTKQLGIPLFYGRGLLKDRNTVFVEGEEKILKAKNILLATGSSPSIIPGLEPDGKYVFNTDLIWELDYVPSSILIVGGGAAGVEFAYIWNSYGSKVTLVEVKDRVLPLPGIPEDASRYLSRKLARLGVEIKTCTAVKKLIKEEGGTRVFLSDGSEIFCDIVLVTVGRKPNTSCIGLEEVGVTLDPKGFVVVDEYGRTDAKNIYACGDITSPLMLAHKAMYEGKIAVNHMLGSMDWKRDNNIIPKIVYSALEIASVGLTEDDAEDLGFEPSVGVASFISNPKAMDDSENEGFVRIVVDEETGRILGCHICGPHAGELIHQVVHLMRADINYEFLTQTVFAHPSLSESIGHSGLDVKFGPITWVKKRK